MFFRQYISCLDNKMKAQILLLVIVVFALALCLFSNKIDKYSAKKGEGVFMYKPLADGKFDNSEYQYGNPSQWREDYYYSCLAKECGGNTQDYDCLAKCHLKSFRVDMGAKRDHADWVCYNYQGDEDAYYRCLNNVYSDYKYP